MVELLIGGERDNIFYLLRKSKMAKVVILVLIWWFHNRVFYLKQGILLEGIVVSIMVGAVLLNILIIPFRILGSRRIDDIVKFVFVLVSDGVVIHYLNHPGDSIIGNVVSGVIVSMGVTGLFVVVREALKVHSQKVKFANRDFEHMDGWEFEYWSAQWLEAHGFYNCEVTSGSGDYGADVICEKEGLRYAVQCKKYTGKVPYRAVEEVIAAREYYDCDRAMVFTNSELTSQALEAAKKLGVIIIDGQRL